MNYLKTYLLVLTLILGTGLQTAFADGSDAATSNTAAKPKAGANAGAGNSGKTKNSAKAKQGSTGPKTTDGKKRALSVNSVKMGRF